MIDINRRNVARFLFNGLRQYCLTTLVHKRNGQGQASLLWIQMFRELTIPALYMGLLAAFVGYSSSFAIVLAGITAMGATPDQAATGLFFSCLGMGICGIWLPLITRTPAAIAWSLPGAAFLASTAALPGGFGEAVGAIICCAGLIVITGLIPALGRLVAAIPKPVANALLAGVLIKLCLAPALALGSIPLLVLPVLFAWLIGLTWHKLAGMPFAMLAFMIVLMFSAETTDGAQNTALNIQALEFSPVAPLFTWQSFISISIPLYLVTMAGQNIPGFALLELNNYPVNRSNYIRTTGLASLLIAPFGAIPTNMSAITAAMMCGPDAGSDPAKRYWAAAIAGICYVILAFSTAIVTTAAGLAPAALITAVAGLALIPALVNSLSGAFSDQKNLEAPALTFLIAASGMTMLGISGAFWGLAAGVLTWVVRNYWKQ